MLKRVDSEGLLRQPVSVLPGILRQLAYADPQSFPVLLDSATVGPLGRYSVLAAFPQAALWQDTQGTVHASGQVKAGAGGFLKALEVAWRAEHCDEGSSDGAEPLPFRGGWVVYLGYELATEIEPRLALPARMQSDDTAPAAFALRIPAGLIYDHAKSQAWMFAEQGDDWLQRLASALMRLPSVLTEDQGASVRIAEEAPEQFRSRVLAALDYIRAGDIYQANLSRPWRGQLAGDQTSGSAAPQLYERLRTANPAPFGALAQFRDWRLLSSSPERLVRVNGARVETRPIAGTRPRSGVDGRHAREVASLIAHPKERAEHVMLIDLERNDLGRICRAGTVRADEFMAIESYAHVHHIVSNVCGELLPHLAPTDVLRAVFPGGTITGCPKFRCMQIIAELEAEARQAYTGALGFINHDGSMDFNILIRSMTLHGRQVEFRTGAGIVADSDWQRELAETRAKARGLLRGLGAGGST
jgi:anthranilate synthase component 1